MSESFCSSYELKVVGKSILIYRNNTLMLCPEWYAQMRDAKLPPEGRDLTINYSDYDDPILLKAVKSIQLLKAEELPDAIN